MFDDSHKVENFQKHVVSGLIPQGCRLVIDACYWFTADETLPPFRKYQSCDAGTRANVKCVILHVWPQEAPVPAINDDAETCGVSLWCRSAFNSDPICHHRSTGRSVSKSHCLQSRPPSTETRIHSLGVSPLPGERGVPGVQWQAFWEKEIQKQALKWHRRSEGTTLADANCRHAVRLKLLKADEVSCTMNLLTYSAPLWLEKCNFLVI